MDAHLPLVLASDVLAAREQMAFTLGFHIILASLGIAFPTMMLIANYIGLRRRDPVALELAQRWSKIAAVTFAVGAVTGTVLSFEFGLLWPRFTGRFGDAFGVLFVIEGIFFFLEAIFITIYIFGWKRLSGWKHFWTGIPVAICGIGGAFSVVAVNGWMNQPQGFTLGANGEVTDVEPLKVIFNPAVPYEVPHMILAGYLVTTFLIAAVYAVGMLRGRRDRHHRLGLLIPLTVGCILAPIQFMVGDTAARSIADDQPVKFAAMECVQETHTDVTEYIGGRCTSEGVKGGIGIPGFDSWLVGFSTDTKVTGLDSVPPGDRPPANTLLHWAFDFMAGVGSLLILLGIWFGIAWWRRRDIPPTKWFLRAVVLAAALVLVTLEAGWIVTEVGRQPWIVYEHMRTDEAVTGAGGIWVTFGLVVLLYALLGTAAILVLRAMTRRWREQARDDVDVPYGPRGEVFAGAATDVERR
jgi:cytochrome d ubiquinol oxidase subunit I